MISTRGQLAADAPDHMSDHPGGFLAGGDVCQGRRNSSDGFPGSRLEDQDRLKAGVARMGREQRKLLAAMGQIDRVVDVEHDPAGTRA